MDNIARRSAPLPAVLQSVKHDTRGLLAERLEALFHSADDALFEMADRASSDIDQNLYFDSMRIVRLQRASIQQKYIDAYSRSWSGVMNGEPIIIQSSPLDLDADDFSLLANDELEISVAAAGISSKVTTQFLLPITHLSKRLEEVCGGELVPELNPLGPQCLNQNFISAIEPLDVHIKVRIILLKLFERFVADELGPVYDRANMVLIDAGVLPNLKYRVKKSEATNSIRHEGRRLCESVAKEIEAEATNTGVVSTGAANADAAKSEEDEFAAQMPSAPPLSSSFENLQTLLTKARASGYLNADVARRATSAPGSYASEDYGDATLVSTPRLMQVLGAIQGEASESPLNLEAPEPAIDLRSLLVSHTTTDKKPQLEKQSDDVVDLVKLLFDYILNDHNLAIPMKALIGRLQIPVLKVAIMDQSFFAKPSHPARQLLNELAAAGIGWSSAGELKRDETYSKIESIVLRVMNGFTEDLTLFSNLIAELRHFVKKEKKKRNQVEQRVKETEAGKAKTREARKTVQTLINQKACGLRLPTNAGHFVSDAWSKVLVYLFVTQGTDSEPWVEAIETLDDLLWAAQPLTSESDVALREELLPKLLTQLESGITLANLTEAQDQLVDLRQTIEDLHDADQRFLDDSELAADTFSTTEQAAIVLVQDADQPPDELENLADPQFVEKIIQLTEGQWVELRDNSGVLIRCKLAALVQPGNRYVFVNRKGMKVCERTRNALALALQAEELNLLDETEMFDRALESVIGNLQQMQDNRR